MTSDETSSHFLFNMAENNRVCTWQQIEKILSQAGLDRKIHDIHSLIPWFQKRSTLFQSLDTERLTKVIYLSKLVSYKADQVIVHQGEISQGLYIIVRGGVAIHAKKLSDSENPNEPVAGEISYAKGAKERARFGQELCVIRSGRCFGELSFIAKHGERNATVITDEACVLVYISRDVFVNHVPEEFAQEIIKRTQFVANHPLFRLWPSAYRNLLAENFLLRELRYGEYLVRQGDKLDSVFFLLGGQAQVTVNPILHEDIFPTYFKKEVTPAEEWDEYDESRFDPLKKLSVITRRQLRHKKGYQASERRFRETRLCTVGENAVVGDIESILELPYHTITVQCTQGLTLYEIDKASFTKIIVRKNPETLNKFRKAVQEKLSYRLRVSPYGIPLYAELLKTFDKTIPKDKRQQILKAYHQSKGKKKPVTAEFFKLLSMGITTNRSWNKKELHGRFSPPRNALLDEVEDDTPQSPSTAKSEQRGHSDKFFLFKKVGQFAGKMLNVRQKGVVQEQVEEKKKFSVADYKELKKKMQALNKSALKPGGWSQ